MQIKQSILLLALLLPLTVLAGCDSPQKSPLTPSAVMKKYFSALEKADYDTLKAITTPDFASVTGDFRMAVGAARMMKDQRGGIKDSTHTIDEDVATVTLTFGNDEVINAILIDVAGEWKIYTMANEQLIPASSLFGQIEEIKASIRGSAENKSE